MSGRSKPEWIGETPDSKVPPRVRLRVFERSGGMCHISARKIAPGDPWDMDHKIALANGGENRESNLAPALRSKHREKTKCDVKEKSRIAAKAKRHLGIKRECMKIPQPAKAPQARPDKMPIPPRREIYGRTRNG